MVCVTCAEAFKKQLCHLRGAPPPAPALYTVTSPPEQCGYGSLTSACAGEPPTYVLFEI